jgi:excisionase family DNA binding protein
MESAASSCPTRAEEVLRARRDTARPANENDESTGVDADTVLDVEDVARLLRVGRNTIYELVARNQIPHRRLLKQIRFSRAAVMAWLDSCGRSGARQGH